MDLGFAGLIQEIDKRFGRLPTDIILLMLFVLIVLWVGRGIVEVILWYSELPEDASFLEKAYRFVGFFGMVSLLVFAGVLYLRRQFARMRQDLLETLSRESDDS